MRKILLPILMCISVFAADKPIPLEPWQELYTQAYRQYQKAESSDRVVKEILDKLHATSDNNKKIQLVCELTDALMQSNTHREHCIALLLESSRERGNVKRS